MMKSKYLPVDTVSLDDYLITDQGLPVWPARDPEIHSAILQITKTFGAKIINVKSQLGKTKPQTEKVIALGSSYVIDVAKIYAHLTRRELIILNDLDSLKNIDSPTVVVTTTSWISLELMDILYSVENSESVPGIIFSSNHRDLLKQALVRSAAAFLSGSTKIPRIDIYPDIPVQSFRSSGLEVFGGTAHSREIGEALEKGAGVLTISAHMDGIDANLGNSILCPMDTIPNDADRNRSPSCYITGICHRKETLLQEALNSGDLIPPEKLSACILVLQTCWGILLQDTPIDTRWGLAPRLLSNSKIGAIIASWEIIVCKHDDLNELSVELATGAPVGKALAKFLSSPIAKSKGLQFCLFGDPAVCLEKNQLIDVNSLSILLEKSFKLTYDENQTIPNFELLDIQGCSFIKAYINYLFHIFSEEQKLETFELIDAIHEYEFNALIGRELEDVPNAPGSILRSCLLSFLLKRGSGLISKDWMNFIEAIHFKEKKLCINCGRNSKNYSAVFRIPWIPARLLSLCPYCGVVSDMPEYFPQIKISVHNCSSISLEGNVPEKYWKAGILLWNSLKKEKKVWNWPEDENGKPLEVFKFPSEWPDGPLGIVLFFTYKSNLGVFRCPARKNT